MKRPTKIDVDTVEFISIEECGDTFDKCSTIRRRRNHNREEVLGGRVLAVGSAQVNTQLYIWAETHEKSQPPTATFKKSL